MQQWEYKELFLHRRISLSELNEEGARGWELCDHTQGNYTFKRPIPQPSTVEKMFNEVKNEVEGIPMAAFDEHPPCTCGTDELCRIHSV